jgi:hypothetical protein
LRASTAAGHQQKIAWVELGYYSGMILGLIIWKFPNVEISFITALIFDAIVQICAGLMDIVANYIPVTENLTKNTATLPTNTISLKSDKKTWGWRLALAVATLTIGIQVIVFNLAHHVSEHFSPFILASFYFGVSIAALTCKKYKIYLEWNYFQKNTLGYATICVDINDKRIGINFLTLGIAAAICVLGAVLFANFNALDSGINQILFLSIVFSSAFFYEILALALIDRIGLEDRYANTSGMVIRTYGLMGIGSAISLWLFGITDATMDY